MAVSQLSEDQADAQIARLRALPRDPLAYARPSDPQAEARDWLARAERGAPQEVELDALRDQLARALYWALHEALCAEGMEGEIASRVALRAARQAVMRKMGFEQREIAALQDIGLTTAKEDAARVRAVLASGALEAKASRRLPKVPVPPAGRLSVPPTLTNGPRNSRR
jgi:hypothetical protein